MIRVRVSLYCCTGYVALTWNLHQDRTQTKHSLYCQKLESASELRCTEMKHLTLKIWQQEVGFSGDYNKEIWGYLQQYWCTYYIQWVNEASNKHKAWWWRQIVVQLGPDTVLGCNVCTTNQKAADQQITCVGRNTWIQGSSTPWLLASEIWCVWLVDGRVSV